MKFNKQVFMLLTVLLLSSHTAFALENPRSLATDSRIKVVAFQPNQVISVNGSTFITTQIIVGQNEQIVDVEGGDAAAWTINIDKGLPNVLNIKPTLVGSHSNLIVTTLDNTGKRRYYRFVLASQSATNASRTGETYAIQFVYPEEEKEALLAKLHYQTLVNHSILNAFTKPTDYNWNYSFNGAGSIMPLHVFDDGKFTYLQLRPNQLIPAIFAVNNTEGDESVVNYRRSGNYMVIQEVAPQFTLRAGKYAVASIFNNALIQQTQSK